MKSRQSMLEVGKVSVEGASRRLWPFWLAVVFVLLLVTYNPEHALWIPGLLYLR
jgi:TRAP-type C4-dicarboxylate transport system permease large subunit